MELRCGPDTLCRFRYMARVQAGPEHIPTAPFLNGVLVIIIALALPKLRLSPLMQRVTAYGFIYVAWSFTAFYWLGNAAGNRGLTLGDNLLENSDILGIIAFLPGLLSVFIVVFLLAVAANGRPVIPRRLAAA